LSDLNLESPYNIIETPACPPAHCESREASIEAAVHPAPGDALYFVSNNQGGHFFSNNLRDHNRNVAQYRSQRAGLQVLFHQLRSRASPRLPASGESGREPATFGETCET